MSTLGTSGQGLHHQHQQGILPPDCLALVVDCIRDTGTLFSLLTVSKTVFSVAVKRLYRSLSIVNPHRRRAVHAFVRLVLSLTPSQNHLIQALRDEFEVHFPRRGSRVYTDYLAFIRDVAFHPDDDDAGYWRTDHFPRRNSSVYRGMDLRPLIASAICEHRLPSVTGLTIECDHLARYKGYIPHLSSLQRIIFDIATSDQVVYVYDFMYRFIQIHGPKARRVSLELSGAYKEDFATVLGIYSLLDPPNQCPREITKSTFAAHVLHQDTTDFSHVRTIDGFYDDLGHTRAILPRCSRLESLSAKLAAHGPSLFDWVLQERQERQKRSDCPGNRPSTSLAIQKTKNTNLPSPPPLKHIQFHGNPASVFNALCDAVSCVGSTLETIRLQDPDDTNDQPQVYRLPSGIHLPRLRELCVVFELNEYSISFQPNSLPTMPALEVLEMYHSFDRYTDIGGLQYNEDYHEMYPLTTWEVCTHHMPALRVLHLSGRTAAEFHPGSLRFMPCLESLTVRIRSSDWFQYWPHQLWTWDWELTRLKELHVGGAMTVPFVFRALRHMPALEYLRLERKPPTPMPVPDYKTLLMAEDDGSSQTATIGGGCIPVPLRGRPFGRNVKHVFFGGRIQLSRRDWAQLLEHWFPNLEILDLDLLVTRKTGIIIRQARRHRRLRLLTLNMSDDDEHDVEEDPEGSDVDADDGDMIDDGWEPLQDCEDEGGQGEAGGSTGQQVEQNEFLLCRMDDMLYRVKKYAIST